MIKPEYANLEVVEQEEYLTERIKTECKIDEKSENIENILFCSCKILVIDYELKDNKIDYFGKALFSCVLKDKEGEIRKRECVSEFKGQEEMKDNYVVDNISAVAEKVQADLSGNQLSVIGTITVKIKIVKKEEVNAVISGENLVVNPTEIRVVKQICSTKGSYPLEEEIELEYATKEVLYHNANAVITNVTTGVNNVNIEGEVAVWLILLQSGEKSYIIRENKVLPFHIEVECDEAMHTMDSSAVVNVRSFKTDVVVDEENKKSTATLFLTLDYSVKVFAEENMIVASDAFSLQNNIKVKTKKCGFELPCAVRVEKKKISSIVSNDVGNIIIPCNEKIEIASIDDDDENFKITGALSSTAICYDETKGFYPHTFDIPFETTIKKEQYDCDINAVVLSSSIEPMGKDDLEITFDVAFCVYARRKEDWQVVCDVEELEEKENSNCAISVYIPQEGDDLWGLSKRLNVLPEELAQTNSDLVFPLSGKERIIIYRQK